MIGVGHFEATEEMYQNVRRVLDSGRVSYGPFCRSVEDEFSDYHGCRHGVVMNSGTDALRIALHALKIQRGWPDGAEVLVPAVTFVATYNIVKQVGLTPVLVDVDWSANIDTTLLRLAITDKTVAVIPVHLFGNPINLFKLNEAIPRNVAIVHDACEAAFASFAGTHVGQWDVGCFSFYAAHHVVAGVGGIAITGDDELATIIRSLVNHGRDPSYISMDDLSVENIKSRFRFLYQGYSSRFTELQAAIALPQIRQADQMKARRRQIAWELTKIIDSQVPNDVGPLPWITLHPHEDAAPSWMMFPLFTSAKWRLMRFLEENGIETRETVPLTNQPCYRYEIDQHKFSRAHYINETGLYIPCHQYLTDEQVEYIGGKVVEFFEVDNE